MALTRITKGVIKPNENYQAGIVTATGLDVNGNGDISGDLNVGGILTYEDVTSIDAVGVITAQQGIHVGTGISAVGVGTFGGLVSPYADIDDFLDVGSNIQLGNAGVVTATTFKGDGDFVDVDVDGHTNLDNVSIAGITTISGNLYAEGNSIEIKGTMPYLALTDTNSNPDYSLFNSNGVFSIYDGTNSANRLTISSSGNVGILQDLDVDGHTNLDNVSIAGVTTVTNTLPEIRLKCSDASLSQSEIVGKLSFETTDPTTPTGAGVVSYIETFSATSNGSDYTTSISNRAGAGGGETRIRLGNALGQIRFYTNTSGSGLERLRISSTGRLAILNNNEDIDMDSSSSGQFQIDGNGYTGAITLNDEGMFLYHNSSSRYIGIGINETEVGRFVAGGYEQRFSNTTQYSSTTGARKGIYVFNSGGQTNCYASLELGATNSSGYFGSTILNSIATADTNYSNHFAIQLRHAGNYNERFRINSQGECFIGASYHGYTNRSTDLSITGPYQDPTGVWTQVGVYSDDGYAANKGGTIGFGGQDGSTPQQQFAAIKGAKENGTSGNYAGNMTFYTRPAGAVSGERLRITSTGKIGINYAGTPPEETFMIRPASDETVSRLTLSHLSSGNSYGARISTIGGASKGFDLATQFNSSYITRARMTDTGVFQLSPSNAISSVGNSFALNIATAQSNSYNVYSGISMKNLESGGGNGMCIHTTSSNWDLYTRAGNQSGLSIAHSNVASSSHSRMYVTEAGEFCVGTHVYDRLNTARKGHSVFHVAGGGLSVGARGNTATTKDGGRYVLGWYMVTHTTSNSYTHLITDLWAGGSPHGNNEYIMGGFHIHGHQYSGGASVSRERIYFHNWSGSYPGYSNSNPGNWSAGSTVYTNSSGYVTLRLIGGSYRGFIIDLVQHAWYPTRDITVTAVTTSDSATL